MQQFHQLEVVRSGQVQLLRWPSVVNILAVSVAGILLVLLSAWTIHQSESALDANVASKLKTILRIESEAVRQWIASERELVEYLASDNQVSDWMSSLQSPPSTKDFSGRLKEFSRRSSDRTYVLMAPDGQPVAESGKSGFVSIASAMKHEVDVLEQLGGTSSSSIFKVMARVEGQQKFGLLVMAPIQNPQQETVGFLGMGREMTDDLTDLLRSSRSGDTGEVLAVTATGELISRSRFFSGSNQLKFLSNHDHDAAASDHSKIQVDLSGQTDHRGIKTVYSWRWMPSLGIGLVAKMDQAEAEAPVSQIRSFVWTLFGLLLLTTISTLFYRWYVYRLRMTAKRSELKQKRLGAYELEGKVGEGGMGVVYRAKHALMRRPTAIKILPPERSSQASIERFEREVQYTSQLQHPNTIAIYDYGRSEGGLFYYAMELVNGLNLEQLVRREGSLPDGRVIEILAQVCASLREAHALGLVHRDIKPSNIMLCDQAGAVDTVKVLDFGMVRSRDHDRTDFDGTLSGTPIYMAPECFIGKPDLDSRVDVFSVGGVAFFLLTGEPLFAVNHLSTLLKKHREDISQLALKRLMDVGRRTSRPISSRLAKLTARCLSADLQRRPSTIVDVLDELRLCRPRSLWHPELANAWWRTFESTKQVDSTPEFQSSRSLNASPLEATQPFVGGLHSPSSAAATKHRFVEC